MSSAAWRSTTAGMCRACTTSTITCRYISEVKTFVGVLYTLLPEILLFTVAALLAGHAATLPYPGQLALQLAACAILLAALALCLQFNRSRMFFALLTLLLAYGALLARAHAVYGFERAALGGLLGLCLPLDLLVFSSIPERGVFSRYGAPWFGLLGMELLAAWGIQSFPKIAVIRALHVQFLALPQLPLSQPGLLAMLAGLLW